MQESNEQRNSPDDVEERIRQRAYEIYRTRGDAEGDPVSDWLAAEDIERRSAVSDETRADAGETLEQRARANPRRDQGRDEAR